MSGNDTYTKELTLINPAGLHTETARTVVKTASHYMADISVAAFSHTVNAKSMMGLMSLGIPANTNFTIIATGDDSRNAIDGITNILSEKQIAVPAN